VRPERQSLAGIVFDLFADATAASRRARRHPWSHLAVVLILAVALGTALASFHIASAMLHGPLPYPQADRIVVATKGGDMLVNYYNWTLNPRADSVFSSLAEYHLESDYLNDGSVRRPWIIACVTPQFFQVLGIGMSIGTGLPDSPPSAAGAKIPWMPLVLSNRAWVRYFHSDRMIVGRWVRLTRLYPFRFEIVGVAPPGVHFPAHVDAWIPEHLTSSSTIQTAGISNWKQYDIGRLRANIGLAQAERIIQGWPPPGELWPPKRIVALAPLRQFVDGPLYRLSTWLWPLTALFLVLALVAAVGVARNDLELRDAEFAIRQSLGGSPGRIFRTYCLELLCQLSVAGIVGAAIGFTLIRITYSYFGIALSPTGRTLTNAALLVAVLGLTAAFAAGPLAVRLGIFGGGFRHRVSGVRIWRPPLQIVAASAILITVVALTHSAYELSRAPTGVRPGGVYVCDVAIPMSAGVFESQGISRNSSMAERDRILNVRVRDLNRLLSFDFARVEARLRGRGGVVGVGLITDAPYSGRASRADFELFGRSPEGTQQRFLPVHMVSIDAGAIPALGMSIVAGRNLNAADGNAVIVNEAAAKLTGSAMTALREYFRPNYPGASWKRIVGVVANAHDDNLLSPVAPTVYLPFRGAAITDVNLVLRTVGMPSAAMVGQSVRSAVQPAVPGAIVSRVRSLSAMVSEATKPNDYAADYLMALALPGLIMVTICAWTQSASELRRREHEIGVRLTLGARPDQIMRLLLRRDAALGLLAGGIGALFAWWLSDLIRYLYRGGASGALDYFAGVAGVEVLALATSYFVFRRALRRDARDLVSSGSSSL
jgi:putative ABC transport system permease protein